MGAGSSHIDNVFKDFKDPLRINDKMNSSIDIVSLIVTRILSTPDIYDLKNLKREGVCGDYIVVLKEKLMSSTALMPYFTASGEEVMYQSPDKLIQNTETRKRVCKEIAESALSVVAIVVSCLASIQVSTKKREQIIIDNIPKTIAPTLPDVRPTPGMIQPTPGMIQPTPGMIQPTPGMIQPTPGMIQPTPGYPAPGYAATGYAAPGYPAPGYAAPGYAAPGYPVSGYPTSGYAAPGVIPTPRYPHYGYSQMQGAGYDQTALDWLIRKNYIQKRSGSAVEFEFVDMNVPKTQTFVLDTKRSENEYQTITPGLTADVEFYSTEKSSFSELNGRSIIFQALPPISMPNSTRDIVLPIRILDATGIPFVAGVLHNGNFLSFTESPSGVVTLPVLFFLMFRLSQSDVDQQLKTEASRILDSKEQRIRNNTIYEQGKQDPNRIVQPILQILSGRITPYYSPSTYGAVTPGYYGMMSSKPSSQIYTIPAAASFSILQTLDLYKSKIASDSCPAMIRVKSLLDEITENRRVRTKFCSDIYWTQSSLSKIYPYTTFQFLCIKDWSSPNILEPAFNTFCESLVKVYNDASGFAPKLLSSSTLPKDLSGNPSNPIQSQFGKLDTMRFDSASYESLKKEYCTTGPFLAEPASIDGVVQELNAEFKQHIAAVLKVIDSLVIVIKDPDTKAFVPRLSPEITSRKRSTKEFILKQKAQAMELISKHYIRVEELYLKGMKLSLQNREVKKVQKPV